MSDKSKSALYEAMKEPIMALRISLQRQLKESPSVDVRRSLDDVDAQLFRLEQNIWRGIHSALNLEGAP